MPISYTSDMNLSDELKWRGFLYQTTYADVGALDTQKVKFYWGVDPSADSMTVGNLAAAMLAKCLIKHGHQAVLLVGGATGMIGDPDGKAQERELVPEEEISQNKQAIAAQYKQLFSDQNFDIVDNYDWFKGMGYLQFLRETGKHVPLRQMLNREFVQNRVGEGASGISYAEFSYVLIQAYDFLYLNQQHDVTLQICGSDQWGNSIAGVDLVRRKTGNEVHVLSNPLIVDVTTGKKFGKTEDGAIWLDPSKTTPTAFYQFWINVADQSVEPFLKIYTELDKDKIEQVISDHAADTSARNAQKTLAWEVTKLIHGEAACEVAAKVTGFLTGHTSLGEATDKEIEALKKEIPVVTAAGDGSIIEALVTSGLAASNSDARRLLSANAISVNSHKANRENFTKEDFVKGRALVRRGKAYKDSALILL